MNHEQRQTIVVIEFLWCALSRAARCYIYRAHSLLYYGVKNWYYYAVAIWRGESMLLNHMARTILRRDAITAASPLYRERWYSGWVMRARLLLLYCRLLLLFISYYCYYMLWRGAAFMLCCYEPCHEPYEPYERFSRYSDGGEERVAATRYAEQHERRERRRNHIIALCCYYMKRRKRRGNHKNRTMIR